MNFLLLSKPRTRKAQHNLLLWQYQPLIDLTLSTLKHLFSLSEVFLHPGPADGRLWLPHLSSPVSIILTRTPSPTTRCQPLALPPPLHLYQINISHPPAQPLLATNVPMSDREYRISQRSDLKWILESLTLSDPSLVKIGRFLLDKSLLWGL